MRFHRLMLSAAAGMALSVGAAAADCREELAALTGGGAKDGSMAPLSGEAGGATPQTGGDGMAAEAPAEGVAKDGSAMPLATDPGVATSAQDVEAQQQGGATAAEQAMGEAGSAKRGRDAAIAQAENALAAGDEAGCMTAVEAAKGM